MPVPITADILRGTMRLLLDLGFSSLPEFTLRTGRRIDLMALAPDGRFAAIEVKSSRADYLSDRKWPEYRQHCDRLFFATHPGVPLDIFPEECGLIVSDGYGAELLREAPEHRLAPATRKALTLRFARIAADRLQQAEWAANPYMTGLAEE